jgi:anthranilate/para-aminobenzoate synthase component II
VSYFTDKQKSLILNFSEQRFKQFSYGFHPDDITTDVFIELMKDKIKKPKGGKK